jgi:multicomponent Na+:H+ antiporter subunit B
MPSLILQTAVRYLVPLLLMFSVFLLLRGHNEPGGGFVGGLVAGSAFALYGIADGMEVARQSLRVAPQQIIGVGLSFALTSGLLSFVAGHPFMTSLWDDRALPGIGKPGTPVMFDTGVYLVVVGVTTLIVFSLAEETD